MNRRKERIKKVIKERHKIEIEANDKKARWMNRRLCMK